MSSVNDLQGTSNSPWLRTLDDLQQQQRTPSKALGQQAFMKILTMQLANQNPLEPVSDTDFIAQMAQFSALEQMQQLNSGFATSQAYGYSGKYVTVQTQDANGQQQVVYGRVDGVIRQDGVDYVMIQDALYPASKVCGVFDSSVAQGNESLRTLQSAVLIGKQVSATLPLEDGQTRTVSGVVEKVLLDNGLFCVLTDGEKIPLSCITEISQAA